MYFLKKLALVGFVLACLGTGTMLTVQAKTKSDLPLSESSSQQSSDKPNKGKNDLSKDLSDEKLVTQSKHEKELEKQLSLENSGAIRSASEEELRKLINVKKIGDFKRFNRLVNDSSLEKLLKLRFFNIQSEIKLLDGMKDEGKQPAIDDYLIAYKKLFEVGAELDRIGDLKNNTSNEISNYEAWSFHLAQLERTIKFDDFSSYRPYFDAQKVMDARLEAQIALMKFKAGQLR